MSEFKLIALLAAFGLTCIIAMAWIGESFKRDFTDWCNSKGGQAVRVDRSIICLSKESVFIK